MNGALNVIFFCPTPWSPGEGSKGQISFNFNYKVNFKDFYSKLCVCCHKWKIQNISNGLFILLPGSCPRSVTWGYLGAKIKFRPAVCLLRYLLLKHWVKFNQIWCVSYSHDWGAQLQFFLAPLPGEGSKGQISFKINYKVNFKDFHSKLCVCTYKWKIQNMSDGSFILSPGSCTRGGTWGYLGAKIKFRPAVCLLCYLLLNHWTKFNQIWCVSYSHELGVQCQVYFWPGPPGEGSKII